MRVQHVQSREKATAFQQDTHWLVVFDNYPEDSYRYSTLDYPRWFRNISEAPKELKDNVNSPEHYTNGHVETIYAIENVLGPEGFKAYCMGNYMKYMARHRKKNGEEDLKKAGVYLGWAANGLPAPVNGKLPK